MQSIFDLVDLSVEDDGDFSTYSSSDDDIVFSDEKSVTFSDYVSVMSFDTYDEENSADASKMRFNLRVSSFEKVFFKTLVRRNVLLQQTIEKILKVQEHDDVVYAESVSELFAQTKRCETFEKRNKTLAARIDFCTQKMSSMTAELLAVHEKLDDYVDQMERNQKTIENLAHGIDVWKNLLLKRDDEIAVMGEVIDQKTKECHYWYCRFESEKWANYAISLYSDDEMPSQPSARGDNPAENRRQVDDLMDTAVDLFLATEDGVEDGEEEDSNVD